MRGDMSERPQGLMCTHGVEITQSCKFCKSIFTSIMGNDDRVQYLRMIAVNPHESREELEAKQLCESHARQQELP